VELSFNRAVGVDLIADIHTLLEMAARQPLQLPGVEVEVEARRSAVPSASAELERHRQVDEWAMEQYGQALMRVPHPEEMLLAEGPPVRVWV
jgi:hypothetical protein